MPTYLLIFNVRASHVRDHSVERMIDCENDELAREIQKKKQAIEDSIQSQNLTHWAEGDYDRPRWVTVVLTQVLPTSK